MLYLEPLPAVEVAPNVQAHLSASSSPRRSYQAFRSGSVVASSSSCAMMLAMPSAPAFPLGEVVCSSQADGHRSGLPTKAYLISLPPMLACVCQPQYCVQKPLVSFTSADVSTKYTPFVSVGLWAATMAWMSASARLLPRE